MAIKINDVQITWEHPSGLLANPRNHRTHPKAQATVLRSAFEREGWIDPIIVNTTTGHIIDGHLRVALANEEGLESVPVIRIAVPEKEERIILARHDRIGDLAEIDLSALKENVLELEGDGIALDEMGWDGFLEEPEEEDTEEQSGEAAEPSDLDRDVLTKAFIHALKGIDERQLVQMLYSKYEAILDFSRLCKGKRAGQKISMLFNPHRFSTATHKQPSIVSAFSNEAWMSGLARATIFAEQQTNSPLYHVLQLGVNGVQYVNEFPPHVAQEIYLEFKAKRILDPCAGWGGRMIGAASIGAFYHGFEPSTKTYNGLLELGAFLKSFETGFDFKIENIPFEDSVLSDQYDVALTSPPYYDTERYSDEETQSWVRYPTFDSWCVGFYLPMVRKTLAHTRAFIINIGSRKYPLDKVLSENFVVKERDSALSGGGGLRNEEGREAFFLVKAKNA